MNSIISDIQSHLFSFQDKGYLEFNSSLIPNVDKSSMIGVRIPILRQYAKQLAKTDTNEFLHSLPHKYFDENQLHSILISNIKDFDSCIDEISRFLPFIDNWATCDILSPKILKKHHEALLPYIMLWIKSDKTYTVRFAISMLMSHFLEEDFDIKFLDIVSNIRSKEYYINMMIAWYFATALAKQYEATIPYIENHRLDIWTNNKTIQKSIESYRISQEQKAYLKTLKIKARV